jgi:hypothetical protein
MRVATRGRRGMMDKLPDNVIQITALRINYDKDKKCTCRNRRFEVDLQNREILCVNCGVVVDPFEAMKEIALDVNNLNREIQSLYEQRRNLFNWKPHLLAVRELERVYRGGDMLPCCPHCGRGIEAKELTRAFTNKQMELERRKFEAR